MDDLVERIKSSIENRSCEPWFPRLTHDLATRAWNSLHWEIGLAPDSYGTERVLARSTSAPRAVVTVLNRVPICASAQVISIEVLTPTWATQYQERGVAFYTTDEILHTTILSSLEDALALINQVPSLMRTVAALVRSLHVIRPENADYDVSFSEPHVPFSIFVSVPARRMANDALRVAEAIVHEAMHLQLTLIDGIVPLTYSTMGAYYSPWRGEYRSPLGVLHALYVFQVVAHLLHRLHSIQNLPADTLDYINDRHATIRGQVREIESFGHCGTLTLSGASLSQRLILNKFTSPIGDFGNLDLGFQ